MKKISFLLLGFILVVIFQIITQAQTTVEKEKMNVAILIFDGVEIIDYTGPYEVLGSRGKRNVYTVAQTAEPITTNMGMRVIPNYTFDNQPKPDILVIPGGKISSVDGVVNNQNTIKWIQDNAKAAKYVLSVCNGAFMTAKAGLLDGLEATTIAGLIEKLKKDAPRTKVVSDKRYVDNGKIIVTAGLSSGLDGSLHLVSKIDGEGWAEAIALSLEYDWDPDSKFVRMTLADKKLPGSIYEPLSDKSVPVKFVSKAEMSDAAWNTESQLSPSEMLQRINEKWAAETKWTRTNLKTDDTIALTSTWKFTDEKGQLWNATVSVQPAAGKNQLLVTYKIIRAEFNARAQVK